MFQQILQSITVKIFVAVINFSILIISAKYLGVSSRGEISLFLLNLAIVQGINEIFTGYSIIYFVPKFDIKKIWWFGIAFTIVVCSLSNFVIVLLNKQVQGYESIGYIISILVVLNTFNSMILLGKQAIQSFNALAFLQPFLLLIGIVLHVLFIKQFTFDSYIMPLLASFIISFIVSSFVVLRKVKPSLNNKSEFNLSHILSNGFYYQLSILLFIFCNRYSFYLLPSSKQVGLYASACMLMESVLLVVNSVAPILVSKVANQPSRLNHANTALSLAKMAFLSSCLMVFVLYLIPETVFTYFLGAGFAGVKDLMMAYSPGIMMLSFFSILNHYFSGSGKQKFILISITIGFLVSVSFAPLFISNYNTLGAAYTANTSYLAILIAVLILFFNTTNLKLKDLFTLKSDFTFLVKLIKNQVD